MRHFKKAVYCEKALRFVLTEFACTRLPLSLEQFLWKITSCIIDPEERRTSQQTDHVGLSLEQCWAIVRNVAQHWNKMSSFADPYILMQT